MFFSFPWEIYEGYRIYKKDFAPPIDPAALSETDWPFVAIAAQIGITVPFIGGMFPWSDDECRIAIVCTPGSEEGAPVFLLQLGDLRFTNRWRPWFVSLSLPDNPVEPQIQWGADGDPYIAFIGQARQTRQADLMAAHRAVRTFQEEHIHSGGRPPGSDLTEDEKRDIVQRVNEMVEKRGYTKKKAAGIVLENSNRESAYATFRRYEKEISKS